MKRWLVTGGYFALLTLGFFGLLILAAIVTGDAYQVGMAAVTWPMVIIGDSFISGLLSLAIFLIVLPLLAFLFAHRLADGWMRRHV